MKSTWGEGTAMDPVEAAMVAGCRGGPVDVIGDTIKAVKAVKALTLCIHGWTPEREKEKRARFRKEQMEASLPAPGDPFAVLDGYLTQETLNRWRELWESPLSERVGEAARQTEICAEAVERERVADLALLSGECWTTKALGYWPGKDFVADAAAKSREVYAFFDAIRRGSCSPIVSAEPAARVQPYCPLCDVSGECVHLGSHKLQAEKSLKKIERALVETPGLRVRKEQMVAGLGLMTFGWDDGGAVKLPHDFVTAFRADLGLGPRPAEEDDGA